MVRNKSDHLLKSAFSTHTNARNVQLCSYYVLLSSITYPHLHCKEVSARCTHQESTTSALYAQHTSYYYHSSLYSQLQARRRLQCGGCEPPISPRNATDDTQGCCTSCIGAKQPVEYTLSLIVCVQFRSGKSKINSIYT